MGYDVSSHVVVGLLLKKSDLTRTEEVARCEHNPSTPFCPQCGMQRGKYKKTTYICHNERGEEEYPGDFFWDLELYYFDLDNGDIVVGIEITQVQPHSKCRPVIVDMKLAKLEVKDKLSNVGIWDESKFGIYHVLVESV